MKLDDLARELDVECRGPADLEITGVAGIEEAGHGQLTFIANQKYAGFARTTRASAILVAPDFAELATATLELRTLITLLPGRLGFSISRRSTHRKFIPRPS